MIPRQTIQQIVETARIEEVVGEFVSLKRRGINWIGLCPFHNEKTPSFNVNPSKNIFKCFGCGKGGDSVHFLMEHEHLSYPEALRYLAKKYNIPVAEEEQTAESLQAQSEREGLMAVSEYAKKYFIEQLHQNEKGRAIGLSYFRERGFTPAIIQKFDLGYCLEEWESFSKSALRQGYNPDYLVKSGLSIRKDDGTLYDRFRGRVIFPIHNLSGRVIAFGGRTLITDKAKAAKYVNSPESEIYNKSKVLYGIYHAKNAISRLDSCLLVEGYTDVLSLHQAGIENVVASSGTSLTTEQIKLISRYTPNIVMLYDGDAAGIKASFRGMDMILQEGLNVRIVLFPDGEDPDSYARSHRSEEVQSFIQDAAVDFITFKTRLLLQECANDPIKKAALLKDIVSSIALIPDAISRAVYITECSRLMNFQESILLNELNKKLRHHYKKTHAEENQGADIPPQETISEEKATQETVSPLYYIEREIMRILLNHGSVTTTQWIEEESDESESLPIAHYLTREILSDEIPFTTPLFADFFQYYIDAYHKNETLNESFFLHHERADLQQMAVDLLSFPHEISDHWSRKGIWVKKENDPDKLNELVSECLLVFKLSRVEQLIKEKQKNIPSEKDENNLLILLSELRSLTKLRVDISHLLGRVVTR